MPYFARRPCQSTKVVRHVEKPDRLDQILRIKGGYRALIASKGLAARNLLPIGCDAGHEFSTAPKTPCMILT